MSWGCGNIRIKAISLQSLEVGDRQHLVRGRYFEPVNFRVVKISNEKKSERCVMNLVRVQKRGVVSVMR